MSLQEAALAGSQEVFDLLHKFLYPYPVMGGLYQTAGGHLKNLFLDLCIMFLVLKGSLSAVPAWV